MHKSAGLTLIEVLIAAATMTIVAMLISTSLMRLSSSQEQQKSKARLMNLSDRVTRNMEADVISAVNVFTRGQIADDYLGVLDLPAGAMLEGSVLPALTSHGYFEQDPEGAVETGNVILLGRGWDPYDVTVLDGDGAEQVLRVDTHVIVLYHVRQIAEGQLDLARWASMPLASYGDLVQIEDAGVRSEVQSRLYAQGVRFSWDPMRPATSGLYEIDEFGNMEPLATGRKVSADPRESAVGVFEMRGMRVATNGTRGVAVPTYARVPDSGAFPGGFEVKVDGPATGKLMLIRLAVCTAPGARSRNAASAQRIVNCRGG